MPESAADRDTDPATAASEPSFSADASAGHAPELPVFALLPLHFSSVQKSIYSSIPFYFFDYKHFMHETQVEYFALYMSFLALRRVVKQLLQFFSLNAGILPLLFLLYRQMNQIFIQTAASLFPCSGILALLFEFLVVS